MAESIALTEGVFYILLSLVQPRHGYGIMQETERMSGGRIRLAAGTLYGALNTLLDRGYIEPAGGVDRRKEYLLTPAGREAALREVDRLRELLGNGERVLGLTEKTERGIS